MGGFLMKENYITNSVLNIGGSDNSINLFEGQYALKNGMSYNSYLIKDNFFLIMILSKIIQYIYWRI